MADLTDLRIIDIVVKGWALQVVEDLNTIANGTYPSMTATTGRRSLRSDIAAYRRSLEVTAKDSTYRTKIINAVIEACAEYEAEKDKQDG